MSEMQGQHVGGLHARVGVAKPDELADEHRGADRQHEGHRDFRDHEPVADAALPRAHRGAAVRLLQRRLRRLRIVARRNKRGRDAERDAGDRADGKQEGEHPPVDTDLVRARKSRGRGLDQLSCSPCRNQQADRTADEREHQAFRHQLAHETPASGAER